MQAALVSEEAERDAVQSERDGLLAEKAELQAAHGAKDQELVEAYREKGQLAVDWLLRQPRVGIRSCEKETMADISGTLGTCLGGLLVSPLTSSMDWDVVLVCTPQCMSKANPSECDTKFCHRKEKSMASHTLDKEQYGPKSLSRVDQRVMGRNNHRWWGPGNGIGDKNTLCQLSNRLRAAFGVEVAAPCFVLPDDISRFALEWPQLEQRWTHWLFKPTLSRSGKGISFIEPKHIHNQSLVEKGSLVGYISEPILYSFNVKSDRKSRVNFNVKTDLRIFGIVTSMEPLRVYISSHSYFRTGRPDKNFSMADLDPLVHITNKRKPKDLQVLNPLPKRGKEGRRPKFASGYTTLGSMEKWWRAVEQAGVEPALVWRNILDTFAILHSGEADMNAGLCEEDPWCFRSFQPFFADLIVDRQGRVTLLETHPSCGLKPCSTKRVWQKQQCGDADLAISDFEVRPGTWGALALGIAHWLQPELGAEVRGVLELRIAQGILPPHCALKSQAWCRNGVRGDKIIRQRCCAASCGTCGGTGCGGRPGGSSSCCGSFGGRLCADEDDVMCVIKAAAFGCLSPEAEQVLVTMAAEERLAPAVGFEDVFGPGSQGRASLPAAALHMWSNATHQLRVWYAAANLSELVASLPRLPPMDMGTGLDFGCPYAN